MELFERDQALRTLGDCLHDATKGLGRIALVYGEAGIGKTALVESFLAAHCGEARMQLGRCDALFTPQPLGPLHDIAHQTGGTLLDLIESASDRLAIFGALLRQLQDSRTPTVLVFEDVHWADAATLDLLKYLGRRIRATTTLIVLTYRDDELDGSHPLWSVLGNLPSDATRRVRVEPLTKVAVARLAGNAGLSERIHAQTGGNPFYVTELLASPEGRIPATVRDATLARATRLSSEARAVLEFCSVVPNRIELWLLDEPSSSDLLDECISTGLIVHQDAALMFRHELAREAVESALPPRRLRSLHETVLCRLLERGSGSVATTRLVHHATRADDHAAARRYAPAAAREASMLGAHREAAAHYQTALDYALPNETELRANLLEARAYECSLIDRIDHAVAARETALPLRRQQGNLLKAGDNLRWLSRLAWFRGRGDDARQLAMEAVEVLGALPPGAELAMAYSNMAQLHMMSENGPATAEWGARALELAQQLDLTEVTVHALNNIGVAEFLMGDREGSIKLERSLELARAHELHEHAARAYTNLAYQALITRDYARAESRLAAGLAYARARDLDSWTPYLLALSARAHLEKGLWHQADEDASAALEAAPSPVTRVMAAVVLGLVRLRRGDPGAETLLDEARELALATGDIVRIGPAAAARAEAAWLKGDKERVREEAQTAYELALRHPEPWRLGELSLWLKRAGAPDGPTDAMATPYRLEMSGDWQAAAAAWQEIGCPYEQALALAHGDLPARLQALDILTGLGATPAAAIIRRSLRVEGVRGIPRGPRTATKGNPLGLTTREADILALLAGNLTNKEIAARLRISPKTVDHHMVAVLAKLGVSTRREAAGHPAVGALLAKDRESTVPKWATAPDAGAPCTARSMSPISRPGGPSPIRRRESSGRSTSCSTMPV